MNIQEKTLLGIGIAIVLVAVYITFVQPQPAPADTTYAEELLRKSVEVGKGQDEYLYYYRETSDGYIKDYKLLLKGGEKMIEIESPISVRTVYFLENDTILCVKFMNADVCSSVKDKNESMLVNYLSSLEGKFFNDIIIESESRKITAFLEKGYLTLSPETPEKTVSGKTCNEVNYAIDYTNMTVSEASNYGVSPYGPRRFEFAICVNNKTGLAHSKYFNYTYQGIFHEWEFQLLDADWSPSEEIAPPENLTEGAYDIILEEAGWQNELRSCFDRTEESRDKCVHDLAITLKMKGVCELAGERRDWCLVSVVALSPDETICPEITNAAYRDDCYVEIAVATKNQDYCSMVADAAKKEDCINASTVVEEVPEAPPELPLNETNESESS